MQFYEDGTHVTVHSLGPKYGSKTFRAIVRGIAVKDTLAPSVVYILQAIDQLDKEYEYTHYSIVAACIRQGW